MLKMLSFKKGLVIEARLLLLAQFFIEMDLLISFLLEPSLFASLSFDALQFLKALPLLQLLLVLFFLEALLLLQLLLVLPFLEVLLLLQLLLASLLLFPLLCCLGCLSTLCLGQLHLSNCSTFGVLSLRSGIPGSLFGFNHRLFGLEWGRHFSFMRERQKTTRPCALGKSQLALC